ncbi:nucleoside monophosphate kinase [bacterium]|nr:nucleoside monophosphate kinase [bacterium]
MAKTFRTILLLGAPGTGKGTQGEMLSRLPGVVHVACGDVFRSLDKTSDLGQVFLQYSTKGELVPDDFTVTLWKEHIERSIRESKYKPDTDLLVLDGIPRNTNQAQILDQYLEVTRIVSLRCDHDINAIVERMKARARKQNRPDDANEQTIRRRFEVYDAETAPLLAHYPASLRIDVDALQTPLEVAHDVLSAVLGRPTELKPIQAPQPR